MWRPTMQGWCFGLLLLYIDDSLSCEGTLASSDLQERLTQADRFLCVVRLE